MTRLFAIATVAAFGLASPALAGLLEEVVPNANQGVEGDINNVFPFFLNGGMRYQQVYASSDFSSFGGPRLITQIAFRPDSVEGGVFNANISDLEVSLSSIVAGPDGLSIVFANNIGADVAQVHDGPITLSSNDLPGPGNTRAFDIIITLQTPFLYDPTLGRNLLLDVRNNDPGITSGVGRIMDAENTGGDPISRVWGPIGNPNAPLGQPDTVGLVTRFQHIVPAPSVLSLLGVAGLFGTRRRRR